ncbi:MAG: hypothetical protein K2K76_01220 [Muribaculaceae bacterium]|nr:hypothetical protein [Muribaculaceae bacterium]
MNQSHKDAIYSISQNYLNNCKPLLEILKVRTKGKYPKNCLNEIRAINDHVARCYRDRITTDEITKELGKAEGHLQRLTYDCYKQLIIYQVSDIRHTIKWFYSSSWPRIGGGELWRVYISKFKQARQAEKNAKYSESINPDIALGYYDFAYNSYQDILYIFKKYEWQIRLSAVLKFLERIKNGLFWLITTFVLAIISAILAGLGIFEI